MAFLKKVSPGGKKQAPMPGPKSAAYKKIVAAKKSTKSAGHKGGKKKPGTAFSSIKAKQMVVDRIKRTIWASFVDINEAIIKLAKLGNCTAAKTLFDFAGVYSLPTPDDDNVNASATPQPIASVAAPGDGKEVDPLEGLFRSIGLQSGNADLEPEMVAAG